MNNSYMGLIIASQNTNNIRALTKYRTIATIPVAGRYRIIDFPLTNLTRIGMSNIGIIVPHKHVSSLRLHIRGGQFWDLNRKNGGIFLMHPTIEDEIGDSNIDNFRSNLKFLSSCKENHIILCSSNLVTNIDFKTVIESHENSNADLTIVYKKIKADEKSYIGFKNIILDENNKVVKFGLVLDNEEEKNVSLEMKIIKKDLLIDLLINGVQNGVSGNLYKFIEHFIQTMSVNLYEFKGYAKFINSTKNYFDVNKDMLNNEIRNELLLTNGGISTKINDTPPSIYKSDSKIHNSLISNGCIIKGSIKDSVLGRNVVVGKNANIENSIILRFCVIEEGANIKNVIIDNNLTIKKNEEVIGSKDFPLIIEQNNFQINSLMSNKK